jgi:hypothetical protein
MCNRPLSAVIAALVVAAAFVLAAELYRQPSDSPDQTAENALTYCSWPETESVDQTSPVLGCAKAKIPPGDLRTLLEFSPGRQVLWVGSL